MTTSAVWTRAFFWLIAATVVTVAAHRLLDVRHGLNAVYFAGTEWQSSRTLASGVDLVPSTEVLKQRQPDFASRPFSVEWSGVIVVPSGGVHTFSLVSDDGSFLYVRGQLVVANPGRHGPSEARGSIDLPAGVHAIFIRYFQDAGDCAFEARWARAGDALEFIPPSALLTEPHSYGQLLAGRATDVALTLIAIAWCGAVVLGVFALGVRASRLRFAWRDIDPFFASVLALSALLNIWGIWWGLPNTRGWAVDEVVPTDVLNALSLQFSNGWYDKYPPFHFAVLALADTPMLLLSWLGLVDLRASGPYMTLFLIGRFVSVVLGLGTVTLVYLCGRELYGSRGAAFAALTMALMVPFTYYAMLSNLDVPYLFWFALSLLAYIRILKRHARSDYLLFAASAALAVCTKDQAYGLFVLSPLAILVARWQRWRSGGGGSGVNIVFDRTTLAAAGVAIGTFLIADNLLFNFGGFVEHVKVILGPASSAYRMVPASVAGQLRLAWLASLELRYMWGWPLAVIVAVAVAWALVKPTTNPSPRWLLVPALSYYITFIGVVLYFFDRFLLPIGLVLSLLAGGWLERFVAPAAPARRLRLALVSAALSYSVLYVATVDYALTTDSRYTITKWLKAHGGEDHATAALGARLEYFTLPQGLAWTWVESVQDVVTVRPAFIVANPEQIAGLKPTAPERVIYNALRDRQVPYRLALRYRTPPLPLPGRHPDLADPPRAHEFSSISRINPPFEVYERVETSSSNSTWGVWYPSPPKP